MFFALSVSLLLYLSFCLSVSPYLSLCLCPCLRLSLDFSFCLSAYFCLCLYIFVSAGLSLFASFCLSLSASVFVFAYSVLTSNSLSLGIYIWEKEAVDKSISCQLLCWQIVAWMRSRCNTHIHTPGKDHYCLNVKYLHGEPQAGNDNTETGSSRTSPEDCIVLDAVTRDKLLILRVSCGLNVTCYVVLGSNALRHLNSAIGLWF